MYYSQLRAFHAVAVHGGFSKAAEALRLTQPAMSDQVRKLESYFNVLLFNRQKRGVTTTELGQRLLEITHRMFETETQAIELLSEARGLETGFLKITSDAPSHVLQIVRNFQELYPGISITLNRGNSEMVLEQLFEFRADIGVMAKKIEDPRLYSLKLRSDPLVAFVGPNSPWARRKTVTWDELGDQPLVLREPRSITRSMVDSEFARIGKSPKVAIEVEGREAAREAVAAGIGVGVVSEPEFGMDKRLKALSISDCELAMAEYLVCLKERMRLGAINGFVEFANAQLETHD